MSNSLMSMEMLRKAKELEVSHKQLISFIDNLANDIKILQLSLSGYSGCNGRSTFFNVMEAGDIIDGAKEDLSK